jgi:hypothetical protein
MPNEATTEAKMTIGPIRSRWGRQLTVGSCQECGAQCAPECGLHPLGCIYGGGDGYWLIADGCELDHGE